MMIALDVEFDYPEMPMHFQLRVAKGERVAIVGESGAGKSTLLNLIAGFDTASRGSLQLNGANHLHTVPAKRPVSMLFQDNNLFLHLTVRQNIGLALAPKLHFNAAQNRQIEHIAAQMGIAPLLDRVAEKLSGGQKQRVALARTLLRDKPILLLDEPFSALDPERRIALQQLVGEVCRQRGLTLLMVTHHLNEIDTLFDRIVRVEYGKIV